MYKVILVDDEYLDLLGLKSFVPWSTYNMEVIAAVKSAPEAEQLLKTHEVDLLVTDIRMPIMSGLELAEKARLDHPHLKILFTSGHQDFQYAKRALAMHANGYVLKPIDDKEMGEQLHLVQIQLEQEHERLGRDYLLHQSLPLVKKQMLHQWFEGSIDALTACTFIGLNEIFPQEEGEHVLRVTIIEIDDVAWKLKDQKEHVSKEIVQETFRLMYQFLEEQGYSIYCNPEKHRVALLTPIHSDIHLLHCHQLINQMKQATPLTVTIGLGSPVENLESVPISYAQAQKALALKMFLGKSRCISFQQERIDTARDKVYFEQKCESLFSALAAYDIQAISSISEDLFAYIATLPTRVSVANFVLYLLSKLDVYLSKLHEHLDTLLGSPIVDLDVLHEFETVEDIKLWFSQNMFQLAEHLARKRQKHRYKLIQEIEQYVTTNVYQNVALRDVAQQFGFSPNYLGFLFKEATGQNFTEYVNRKRLEKAAELLKDPKLRLHQIADQLGYSNITYFGRQFKDFFGQTPGEFRKHL